MTVLALLAMAVAVGLVASLLLARPPRRDRWEADQ